MLGNTFTGCRELRLEMVELYWILLTPVTLITCILEFYRKSLDFGEIVKRVFLSLFLLWSFEYVMEVIAFMSDGIVERMGGMGRIEKVFQHFSLEDMPGVMQFQKMLIFLVSFLCYLLALMSFYLTEILSYFIYAVLYVMSPLAFLCLIPCATQHIARNIYKGIINVAVWRVIWSILGAMLFELIRSPIANWDNFFMAALINLCIGVSMLMVPFFTSSLLSDGGSSVASRAMDMGTQPVLNMPFKIFSQLKRRYRGKGQ